MPCRARLAIPGLPWHIIQRGNNRTACFYAEEDYRRYLDTLRQMAEKFECAVHAYVLMTNHVHLLLTPSRKESAGLLMKHLGQRYVQYINRSYRRSGTLWEGRFDPAWRRANATSSRAIATSSSTRCGRTWYPTRGITAGQVTAPTPKAIRMRCSRRIPSTCVWALMNRIASIPTANSSRRILIHSASPRSAMRQTVTTPWATSAFETRLPEC